MIKMNFEREQLTSKLIGAFCELLSSQHLCIAEG